MGEKKSALTVSVNEAIATLVREYRELRGRIYGLDNASTPELDAIAAAFGLDPAPESEDQNGS